MRCAARASCGWCRDGGTLVRRKGERRGITRSGDCRSAAQGAAMRAPSPPEDHTMQPLDPQRNQAHAHDGHGRGMGRHVLTYGVLAGAIVGGALYGISLAYDGQPPAGGAGMALGYATMLVALSLVFVGIKRHRDADRGGVIRFWPAFGMGLAISAVAGVGYVLAWEAVLATLNVNFAETFANGMIERQKAKGLDGAALADYVAGMETFKAQYANPLYRLPMTFAEIFPVGVLVSLVSALVLRNPRALPAHGPAA
jgi:hypothetical protein